MKALKVLLQTVGILLLIPTVAMANLAVATRNNDGPSIIFPGGELFSGELYSGPEPDWLFADEKSTVELQLDGRLWKHWEDQAEKGNGLPIMRIDGVRYERKLVRITEDSELAPRIDSQEI